MSKIYDRACTTCGRKISDHDANECWNYEAHGENYATAKADAERGIAKIKADAALTAVEKVLELHTETVHGECAICFECTYDDGYEVDYSPFDYPCPTVQSVRSAIKRSE